MTVSCSGRKNPTAPDGIDGLCTNIKGCPEGRSSFGSGFPIGASSIPVGTRLSLGKSSVLYLCFRLTLERGWLRYLLYGQIAVDRHFSAAVGQADFVRPQTKSGFAQKQNPPARKRKQRYIKVLVPPQRNVLIPPRQFQPEIIQRQRLR